MVRGTHPFVRGLLIIGLAASTVVCMRQMRRAYVLPYPHLSELIVDRGGLSDIAGVVMGFRSVTADLAWIGLIQYVGGGVLPEEEGKASHFLLKDFALRVIRIDPFFRPAILYSASMLAWFRIINRPHEAIELLTEGIRHDPTYWPYHTAIAAINYKNRDLGEQSIALLEEAVRKKDCPVMIKNILAGIYKERTEYRKAVALWLGILESDNVEYHEHAKAQIENLRELMQQRSTGKGKN